MIYGVGIIDGKKIDAVVNKKRAMYLRGRLRFGKDVYTAASGLPGRFWSVPFGTYSLTRQTTGWIIENMYNRLHIAHLPCLEYVWNIGQGKKDETVAGYDPAAKRTRAELQLHCEPRLITEGCVALDYDDFKELATEIVASPNKFALIVHPEEPHFRIIPE